MILFWLLISFLTLIALGFLLFPLMRNSRKPVVTHTQLQVAHYREQLADLDSQLKNAVISVEAYEQSHHELEQALLANVSPEINSQKTVNPSLAFGLLLILPIVAVCLYLHWGSSRSLALAMVEKKQAAQVKQVVQQLGSAENVINALKAKLQQNPDSAQGWYLLGKLYLSQQQFSNAVAAFAKANSLQANNPDILVNYASSLFFSHKETLPSSAEKLLQQALKLQPANVDALNLTAIAAFREKRYQIAVDNWQKILSQLPANSSDAQNIAIMNAQAQQHLKGGHIGPPLQLNSAIKIPVHVTLAANFKNQFQPNDTLFIYAKAVSGPPMPLAVVRKQVKDLPLTITLSAANVMLPNLKLENFKQVKIFARISKSGQVMPQAGDLQGESGVVSIKKQKRISILIDKFVS